MIVLHETWAKILNLELIKIIHAKMTINPSMQNILKYENHDSHIRKTDCSDPEDLSN